MNTNQLATFLTLLQKQSYQKTAQDLHYSRSTAMDHINSLELELGTKLFEKKGREVVPTASGLQFHIHAQAMMESYQQALKDAANPVNTNLLRVLAIETLGLYFLRGPFVTMMSRYPELELSVRFGSHHAFCEKLRKGEADIAFGFAGQSWGRMPDEDFSVIPICRESIVFFTNPRSRLAGKKTVTIEDISKEEFLLVNRDGVYNEWIKRICRKSGVQIRPRRYIDSGSLLKHLVIENDCVSIVSRRVIEQELKSGTLVELPWNGENMYGEIIAVMPKNVVESDMRAELVHIVKKSLTHGLSVHS